MSKIKSVKAREIKDSRGNPTVEVELTTDKGSFIASCPSGASTGKNEALELRDEDGIGVSKAIKNVNKIIAPALIGKNPANQKNLDDLMLEIDGTKSKSRLGANAILPVSIAICRAGAASQKLPPYQHIAKLSNYQLPTTNYKLPCAMFNILNGGSHAVGRNELAIQEFMIVPHPPSLKASAGQRKKSFSENLVLCNKIFNNLSEIIKKNFSGVKMGDEGGFAPPIPKTEQALFLLKNAIENNPDVGIALDCAASQFYKNGKYEIDGKNLSRSEILEFYADLVKRFDVFSIEDPFAEDDWEGFKLISNFKFQISNFLIVGDDLTTTNVERIKEAHSRNACNGVIIKPNQIGTVSEAVEAAMLAKSYDWKVIVSHRSGETMDTFITDFAVGVGADFIKSGSPSQPERMVKYNHLLEIESELNNNKQKSTYSNINKQ